MSSPDNNAEDVSSVAELAPTNAYDLDHAVCDLLVAMESYQLEREVISRSLSRAFFSIAKARKAQAFLAHPEDIRAELCSNLRVRVGVETASSTGAGEDEESECVCFSAEERERASGAAMLMLCALPPPALKHAKSEFRGAVDEVCALARAAQALQRARERLEVARGLRTSDDCPFGSAARLVREGKLPHTARETGEREDSEGEREKEIAEEREREWTETEREKEGLIPEDSDEPATSTRPLRASLQGQRERERETEGGLQRLSARVPMCADLDSSSDEDDSD